MSMSVTAQKEVIKQQCYAMFPYLIDIVDDNGYPDDSTQWSHYRYVNMQSDVTDSDGNVYKSQPFSLKPFEKTNSKISNGSLTFYDANFQWIPKIRSKNNDRYTMNFVFEIYYQPDDTWTLESIDRGSCTLSNFSWGDGGVVSCTMVFDEDADIVMPVDKMTSSVCPALF